MRVRAQARSDPAGILCHARTKERSNENSAKKENSSKKENSETSEKEVE